MTGNDNEDLSVGVGGTDGDSQDPITPDNPTNDDNIVDPPAEDNETEESSNIIRLGEEYNIVGFGMGWIHTNNYTDEGYFELKFKNENTGSDEGVTLDLFLKSFQAYKNDVESGDLTLIPDVIKNPNFEDGTDNWEINFTKGEGTYEVHQDEESEEYYLQVKLNDESEVTIKQLIDFTNINILSFDCKSNVADSILEYNIYASLINQGGSSEGDGTGTGSGYDEDWTPELIVDTKHTDSEDMTFQARVFHEKNNQVYGAEIVLIPENVKANEDGSCPIETILITDNLKLESFNGLVQNMEKCYVPYTDDDLDNLEIYKKVASGEMDESSAEYRNMKWSKLHDKGDLKTILENNIRLTDDEFNAYERDNVTVINASHLSGFNSGDFVKSDQLYDIVKDNFTEREHKTLQASTSRAGHALIVDNLNESSLSGGRVLSANQGRILNNNINSLENKVNNSWSKERVLKQSNNEYITYKVNTLLRLFVCIFKRTNYRGLQSEIGEHLLYGENTIPEPYQPLGTITTPLHRGDIVLGFDGGGSIWINNLTRQSSIDINVQVMWHY